MPKPQVVKTDTGKVNLIRPVPQLENLVLRGGGVKGIGNPPALIEMDKAGMLGGLKHIVGTSAGALTALCLASGTTTTDFQTLSDTHSPLSLRDNPSNWKKLYPMVEFGVKGYNAVNALQLADKTSAESVSAYLNNNWDTDGFKDKLKTLTDEQRARLAELRNPDLTTNRTGKMVTFKDLETLHQLAPDTFKELTLTGFDETHKTVRYFNATDYPDMPIAIAGRISMSIPQAFAAVNYDPGDGNKKRYFVDGGVGSNMPSEVLTRTTPSDASTELQGRERENVLVRTGIMTFDEGGDEAYQKTLKNIDHNKKVQSTPEPTGFWEKLKPREKEVEVTPLKGAYKAMHGSPQENIIPDSGWMEQTAAGNNIGAVDRWDQKKMAESAANCFVIAHGTLDTGSFIHLQSTADKAKLQASDLMKSQVDNLKDYGAYAQTFDTMDEAYGVLTKAEKEEILKAAPDPQTYAKGDQDPGYKADLELYKKVETEHLKEQQQQQQGQQVDDGNVPKPSVSVRDSMSKSPSSDDAHTNLKLEEVDADEPKVESPKGSVTVKEALGKSLNTTTTTTTKVDGTTKVTL